MTPHGIVAYIPILVDEYQTYADLHWSRQSRQGLREHGLLCLTKEDPDYRQRSTHRSSFCVCPLLRVKWRGTRSWSTSSGGEGVIDGQTRLRASWQEVLIRHRPPPHLHAHGHSPVLSIPTQLTFDAPFRFEEHHIRAFLSQSVWYRAKILSDRTAGADLPTAYGFYGGYGSGGMFIIKVGVCRQEMTPEENIHLDPIWAVCQSAGSFLDTPDIMAFARDPQHNCFEDHVSRWPALGQKTFSAGPSPSFGAVTLSFAPCPINSARTLVLTASFHDIRSAMTLTEGSSRV